MTRRHVLSLALACVVTGSLAAAGAPSPAQALPQVVAGTPELLLDQGKRSFDAFNYSEAVPVFDWLIAQLTSGGQVQRPELLVQAYELRARARFALGDSAGTEQDFSALLVINPTFKLSADISPRVVAVLEAVRRVTIGEITASLMPPGEVQIDGRPVSLVAEPQAIDLPAGDHQLSATRPGYRPIAQTIAVVAGQIAPLALVLERVSATLSIVSVPDGAEVVFDGTPRGVTRPGTGSTSAPFVLNDLTPGAHRLQLRRDCYRDVERTITIERPDDLETGPLPLTPAIASVKVQTSESGAALFVDRAARGTAPADFTLCEGPHTVEVRGPKGRFIDRRDWTTGDNVTLVAELRSAFPIVSVRSASTAGADQLRAGVERALAPAKHVLVYAPTTAELDAAMRGENIPPDWLIAADPNQPSRVPPEVRRDLGRALAAKFDAQGVAAVAALPDPYAVAVTLLAAGSGEPDVITINMADNASQAHAADLLGAPLPPITSSSIETSVVDVTGVRGAVVVRAWGVGEKAGLTAGDVIVAAGGAPVTSVADLRARIAAIRPPAPPLALNVTGPAGAARAVSVTVTVSADTLPLRDASVLYNRALVELEDRTKTAATPLERSAAHLNLAIVDMRLGNWDDAVTALANAQLPDGAGVSSGTVAYLTGLSLEAAGRAADARAAFTKAAAVPLARLGTDGPLIAPLAQQKLLRPR